MNHERGVEFCLLLLPSAEFLHLQQVLKFDSLILVETEQLFHESGDGWLGYDCIDESVHFLLGVVLYFDWLIGEEAEPGLADVPHQLVL